MTDVLTQTVSDTLYDRLGGAPAVTAAVDDFYNRVLADDALCGFFRGTDLAQQRRKQIAFMTFAFGGAPNYSGKSIREAHAKAVEDGLNDTHFDKVAGHLIDTLAGLGVEQKLIDEVIAIVGSTRDDVLGRDVPQRQIA